MSNTESLWTFFVVTYLKLIFIIILVIKAFWSHGIVLFCATKKNVIWCGQKIPFFRLILYSVCLLSKKIIIKYLKCSIVSNIICAKNVDKNLDFEIVAWPVSS